MKAYKNKYYENLKEIIQSIDLKEITLEDLKEDETIQNFSKKQFEYLKSDIQTIVNYFENKLIRPGFYFYDIRNLEAILKSTSEEFNQEEINNLICELLKSDINSLKERTNKLIITPDLINLFKEHNVDILKLKTTLDKLNKKRWSEIFIKLFPEQYEEHLTILISHMDMIEEYKAAYQVLDECYFKNGYVKQEDHKKVIECLQILNASKSFMIYILKQKKKEITPKSKEKDNGPKITPGLFQTNIKPGLNDSKWREIKQKVSFLYDINSNTPVHSLDILEKVELIYYLFQLDYKEDEIRRILCEIDRQYIQKTPTNTDKECMRNVKIIDLLMKKAYKSEHVSRNTEDILKELNNSKPEEKIEWRKLAIDLLKEETREYVNILKNAREEISKMPINFQKVYRDSELENLQKIYGNTYLLLNQIWEVCNKSKGQERNEWKNCLRELLNRLVLEQFGDYEFEISEARKLESQERLKRSKAN